MTQANKTSRRLGLTFFVGAVSALVLVIGCGGGGGGTGVTGSLTTSATATSTTGTASATTATATATTATATGTTATATGTTATATGATATATGSTATGTGSTGTIPPLTGILPPNKIIFSAGTTVNTTVDTVNPDGTGDTPYTSFDATYQRSTPNPQQSKFAFAYLADPVGMTYDIYVNTTTNITGATRLTTIGFSAVYSLQYSPDAAKIVFVATVGTSDSFLYIVNADGTGFRQVARADDAYVAGDNKSIAFTQFDTGTSLGQIYTIGLDGTNLKQVTNDTLDHFSPQWSKDATRLTWCASTDKTVYNVYTGLVDGTQLTQVTNVGPDTAVTPAFSPDGNTVAYVLVATVDTTKTGVYQVGISGGAAQPVLLRSDLNSGLFWTSSVGFLSHPSGATPVIPSSYHIVRLRREGRWNH